MCGRFVLYRKPDTFPVDQVRCEIIANYNIAPSQEIPVIIRQEGKNVLDKFHWGLVPAWAKDKSIGNSLINARSETVSILSSFKNAFRQRRCLIPADGFYEWKTINGRKQPYYFTLSDEKPFAFAGLWETWTGGNEAAYRSVAIITTDASESVKPIHHRMPAILQPEHYSRWMNSEKQNLAEIQKILQNGTVMEWSCRPVSQKVNSVRNNEPGNIDGAVKSQN